MRRAANIDSNRKKPRVKRPRIPECSVEKTIRQVLELNGWRTHKIEVFAGVDVLYVHQGGKRSVRHFSEGDVGQADLLCVRSAPRLANVYIETKALDGRISKEQDCWHAVRRREGFITVIPRSAEDCWAQMRAAGVEPMRDSSSRAYWPPNDRQDMPMKREVKP